MKMLVNNLQILLISNAICIRGHAQMKKMKKSLYKFSEKLVVIFRNSEDCMIPRSSCYTRTILNFHYICTCIYVRSDFLHAPAVSCFISDLQHSKVRLALCISLPCLTSCLPLHYFPSTALPQQTK